MGRSPSRRTSWTTTTTTTSEKAISEQSSLLEHGLFLPSSPVFWSIASPLACGLGAMRVRRNYLPFTVISPCLPAHLLGSIPVFNNSCFTISSCLPVAVASGHACCLRNGRWDLEGRACCSRCRTNPKSEGHIKAGRFRLLSRVGLNDTSPGCTPPTRDSPGTRLPLRAGKGSSTHVVHVGTL
ncbi:hypothetical protein K402DRAFT_30163 [Aulographum hederae CBS 113979]|uniref:Uncharacterized protein n=1 Tax=Aulographum hederae CBS 113979 TaxID=1176131 RepID=A0A6G1H4L0_9PEZI|nr:hypothetical protein K402DRAFT_30163 [Aulographum hederae CBS 113979]